MYATFYLVTLSSSLIATRVLAASSSLLWGIKPPCDSDPNVDGNDEETLVTGVFWTSSSLITTWLHHGSIMASGTRHACARLCPSNQYLYIRPDSTRLSVGRTTG